MVDEYFCSYFDQNETSRDFNPIQEVADSVFVKNIRQNIILSSAVIAFLVPAALAGWIGMVPGLLINEAGGLAVIINGLRLPKK